MSKSSFIFESYKIDQLHLDLKPNVDLVRYKGITDPQAWAFRVGIRMPYYFVSRKIYLGGIEVLMTFSPQASSALDEKPNEQPPAEPLISLVASIMGTFKTENNERFEGELENQLVKLQIPTILLPHLRAAVIGLFASSGIGYVDFPLINVRELAAQTVENLELQIKP